MSPYRTPEERPASPVVSWWTRLLDHIKPIRCHGCTIRVSRSAVCWVELPSYWDHGLVRELTDYPFCKSCALSNRV